MTRGGKAATSWTPTLHGTLLFSLWVQRDGRRRRAAASSAAQSRQTRCFYSFKEATSCRCRCKSTAPHVSAAPPPTSHTFLSAAVMSPPLTPLPLCLKANKVHTHTHTHKHTHTHTHTDDMFINHLFSRATVPDLPLISELSAAEDSRLTFTGRSTLQ